MNEGMVSAIRKISSSTAGSAVGGDELNGGFGIENRQVDIRLDLRTVIHDPDHLTRDSDLDFPGLHLLGPVPGDFGQLDHIGIPVLHRRPFDPVLRRCVGESRYNETKRQHRTDFQQKASLIPKIRLE